MTNATEQQQEHVAPPARRGPRWWQEILLCLILYALYSAVRNYNGSLIDVDKAMRHAVDVVRLQDALHMLSEQRVQDFFLPHMWFIKFLNVYYGTAHFIVTGGILIWLFTRQSDRYSHWRNIIYVATALALVGYIGYPLAPPRLMPPEYGFIDTLKTVGGLWSFENGPVEDISNQYAAMPSLHVCWSLWSALAVMPALRHTWSRVLMALYPALTILAIVVTANHFWMDVFGGALILGCGYLAAVGIEHLWVRRRAGHEVSETLVSSNT